MKKILSAGLLVLALGVNTQAKTIQPANKIAKPTETPDCQGGLLSCGWTYMVCGVAGLDPLDVYDALDEFVCG